MTTLRYTPHERISLKNHAEFNEKWLQERIAEDPTIIGLGETVLLDRERVGDEGGREYRIVDEFSDSQGGASNDGTPGPKFTRTRPWRIAFERGWGGGEILPMHVPADATLNFPQRGPFETGRRAPFPGTIERRSLPPVCGSWRYRSCSASA